MTVTLEQVSKVIGKINRKLEHTAIYVMIVDDNVRILVENTDTEELTAVYVYDAGTDDLIMDKLTQLAEIL